jgi:plasmid stabilization system protein ParE
MRIEILSEANEDLLKGYYFYERQAPNLGDYFLDSLYSDIDSLLVYAGIHPLVYGRHRSLSKRFPFAIYYSVEAGTVRVHAVLDCRRSPSWTRRRLI